MPYSKNLFINCPFDNEYYILLKPLLFTIIYCKFEPKISQLNDSSKNRLKNILNLMQLSKYSIHDISRIEISGENELPRFNMPFELGLDLACGIYHKKDKKCLILDSLPHRYKKTISDISGQDITAHNSDPIQVVKQVRNWIKSIKSRSIIKSYTTIWDAYNEFNKDFEINMKEIKQNPYEITEMPFSELIKMMKIWILNSVQ